jgi:hypothetical protein
MPLLCSHPSLILYDAAATAVVVVKSSSRGRKIGREKRTRHLKALIRKHNRNLKRGRDMELVTFAKRSVTL